MTRSVIPVAHFDTRLPTLGRLRMGMKVEGRKRNGETFERPSSIETWRLTSADQQALEQVAAIYGGTVKPWRDKSVAAGQFEVVTTSSELRIVLPPDPLGNSPIYEMWSRGGCVRRCDGVICSVVMQGQDGAEMQEVDCLCVAEKALSCDVHTRLNVILPEVRFGGVWMLDTSGFDAAHELPGMVGLLQSMQGNGLTVGVLRLEHRRKVVAGETRLYPVPVLGLDASMDALTSGQARYSGSLGTGSSVPVGELGAGEADIGDGSGSDLRESRVSTADTSPASDDIIDAEVIDDRTLADVLPAGVTDAKALVIARRVLGRKVTATEQVSDYRDVAAVLNALMEMEA